MDQNKESQKSQKLVQQKNELQKRIKIREQMEERRNKLENECDEMKAKIAKLENERDDMIQVRNKMQAKSEEMQEKRDEMKKKSEEMEKELGELNKKSSFKIQLLSTAEELQKKYKKLKKVLKEIEIEIEKEQVKSTIKTIQKKILLIKQKDKQDERIKEQEQRIKEQNVLVKEQNVEIDKQDQRINKQDERIKEQDQRIKEQNVLVKEQNLLIDNFTIILQNKRIGINQLSGTVHKLKINNSNKEKIPNDDYLENEFTKFLEMEFRESIDKQIENINFPNKTNQTTINVIQKKVFGEFYKKSYPVNKYKEFKLENLDDSDQLIDFTLGNYIIQNKNPNLNKELKKYQKLILIGVSGCGKTRSIYELGNKQFVIYLIGCGIGSYSLDNSFQRCMFHINNFMNKGNYKKAVE
ncbi:structural maintenance of chromosomes protein [Anaeramoeba flamelloides]|uniref:Structural maintenance of chromosomes protein n=1 Tax=Anaeramoeba flamelloides TaxID=1746091 RepID=A0AAV7YUW1_9EUKA|nr:structural maintenance of chromosomes protein [Anaeramoeba flamelloides]